MSNVPELVVRQQLIDLVTDLFIMTDHKQWDSVRTSFAPLVEFDMTSLIGGQPTKLSPEEIVLAWEGALSAVTTHHQASNFQVSLRESDADVSCYALGYHYLPNPTGRNTRLYAGLYEFHLALKEEQWLIDRMRFDLRFSEGNLALEQDAGVQ
jgi:hypothetical protein